MTSGLFLFLGLLCVYNCVGKERAGVMCVRTISSSLRILPLLTLLGTLPSIIFPIQSILIEATGPSEPHCRSGIFFMHRWFRKAKQLAIFSGQGLVPFTHSPHSTASECWASLKRPKLRGRCHKQELAVPILFSLTGLLTQQPSNDVSIGVDTKFTSIRYRHT